MDGLSDERINVKPFKAVHLDSFVEAVRESEATVGQWTSWCTKEYSHDEARDWFLSCQNNIESCSAYDIGIFLNENDLVAGGISINQIDKRNRIGNIGYWVRGSLQNQGNASRAVKLIKDWGFEVLGLARLEIVILENNLASRRVAEKCGAKLEVIADNRLIHNEVPMRAAVYSFVPGTRTSHKSSQATGQNTTGA